MRPINTYKKCLCCGAKYSVSEKNENCKCGGYLYTVNIVYQKKGNDDYARDTSKTE